MGGMRVLAICSCHTTFYDNPGGWKRFVSHPNDDIIHKWVHVTDLVIACEVGALSPQSNSSDEAITAERL